MSKAKTPDLHLFLSLVHGIDFKFRLIAQVRLDNLYLGPILQKKFISLQNLSKNRHLQKDILLDPFIKIHFSFFTDFGFHRGKTGSALFTRKKPTEQMNEKSLACKSCQIS